MAALNGLAYLIALLIAAGEIARFWGSARFVTMALRDWRPPSGQGRHPAPRPPLASAVPREQDVPEIVKFRGMSENRASRGT
jgi:hypothetical protein